MNKKLRSVSAVISKRFDKLIREDMYEKVFSFILEYKIGYGLMDDLYVIDGGEVRLNCRSIENFLNETMGYEDLFDIRDILRSVNNIFWDRARR